MANRGRPPDSDSNRAPQDSDSEQHKHKHKNVTTSSSDVKSETSQDTKLLQQDHVNGTTDWQQKSLFARLHDGKARGYKYAHCPVTFKGSRESHTCKAYLDSLASQSFMSQTLWERLKDSQVPYDQKSTKKFYPGVGPQFHATSYRVALTFTDLPTGKQEEVTATFYVAPLNGVDLILGAPFLQEHNIQLTFGRQVRVTALINDSPWTLVDEDDAHDSFSSKVLYNLMEGLHDDENAYIALVAPTLDAAAQEGIEPFYKTVHGPEAPVLRKEMHGMKPIPLTTAQEKRLQYLLKDKHRNVFEPYAEVPKPRVAGETFKITLKEGAKPKSFQGPRLSPDKLRGAKEIIEKLIENKFLVESEAAWGSPMLVVYKHGPDGKISGHRAVFDYRYLNSVSERYHWPLPRISELLQSLGRYKVFSGVDLLDGFYQLPVDEDSQDLTTVTTPFGVYKWRVLPMGVSNGPSYFSKFVARAFKDQPGAHTYIDDCGLGAHTVDEGLDTIDSFLTTCARENIKLKESKCFWLYSQIAFLGHLVSHQQLQPMHKHLEAIGLWERPKTRKQMSAFLGLCNYYRDHIQDYASMASALYNWTSTSKKVGKEPVQWTTEMITAFTSLKESLTSPQVLDVYEETADHRISTDASQHVGMGAVFEQRRPGSSEWKPLGYYSKKWSPAQLNYHVAAKEMLAIYSSIRYWQYWLLGNKTFTIRTDSSACSYYLSKAAAQLDQREVRWLDFLADFHFTIEHIAGTINIVADTLSREDGLSSGIHLRVLDLYAGSPTCLRAIQQLCSTTTDIVSVDYQAVEKDPRVRTTINQVHQQLLLDPKVPITSHPWRLDELADHNCQLLDPRHSVVKAFLQSADLVIAGSPCQPWSKASSNPQGFKDPREGFTKLMELKRHLGPQTSFAFENVPFHPKLIEKGQLTSIEQQLGPHQKILCHGSQYRERWIFSNMTLTSANKNDPPLRTWQQCLDAAAAHEKRPPATVQPRQQHRRRSHALMASRNTYSERPGEDGGAPPNWVIQPNKQARSMNIAEREALVGLEFGDTFSTKPNASIDERYRQTGNAVPVPEYLQWLRTVIHKRLDIASSNADTSPGLGHPDPTTVSNPMHGNHQRQMQHKENEHILQLTEENRPKGTIVYVYEDDPLPKALKEFHVRHSHMAAGVLAKTFHAELEKGNIEGMEGMHVSEKRILDLAHMIVSTCSYCQMVKGKLLQKKKHHILPFPGDGQPRPWREVQVDLSTGWEPSIQGVLDPLGSTSFTSILVITDCYTGHVDALPCSQHITSGGLVQLLHHMFCRWGFPYLVYCDSQFDTKVLEEYREEKGIKFNIVPPMRHQRMGQVEKMIDTLQKKITAKLKSVQAANPDITMAHWPLVMSDVLCDINNQPRPNRLGRELCPNEVVVGRTIQPPKVVDESQKWSTYNNMVGQIAKERYDSRKQALDEQNLQLKDPDKFVVGQHVMMRREKPNKFATRWYGDFVIAEVLPGDTYKLASGQERHADDLCDLQEDILVEQERHADFCQACKGTLGHFLMCETCSMCYHQECLQLTDEQVKGSFICPHCLTAADPLTAEELLLLKQKRNQWSTNSDVLELVSQLKGDITLDLCASESRHVVSKWSDDAYSTIAGNQLGEQDIVFVNPPFEPYDLARKFVNNIVKQASDKRLLHTFVFLVPEYLRPPGSRVLKTFPVGSKLFHNGPPRPRTKWEVCLCDFEGKRLNSDLGKLGHFDHYLLFRQKKDSTGFQMLCCKSNDPPYWYEYEDDFEHDVLRYAKSWTIAARTQKDLPPSFRRYWPSSDTLKTLNKDNLHTCLALPWVSKRDPSRHLLGTFNFVQRKNNRSRQSKIPLSVWALSYKLTEH